MNISDLETKQSLCKEQDKQLKCLIKSKQKWVDYFTKKKDKSLHNSKIFFLNFLAYLIIALTCFLTHSPLISSCFAGLSVGCLIVSGYQKFIVYRKFKKVIKVTQKNINICKQNSEKLEELSSEIEAQIKILQKISESSVDNLATPNQAGELKISNTSNTDLHID